MVDPLSKRIYHAQQGSPSCVWVSLPTKSVTSPTQHSSLRHLPSSPPQRDVGPTGWSLGDLMSCHIFPPPDFKTIWQSKSWKRKKKQSFCPKTKQPAPILRPLFHTNHLSPHSTPLHSTGRRGGKTSGGEPETQPSSSSKVLRPHSHYLTSHVRHSSYLHFRDKQKFVVTKS